MRRRDFITLLGGAAAAWPLTARAQQVSSVLRIGYLSPGSASPGPLNYYDEFRRELRELGYVEGQNIIIDYLFAELSRSRCAPICTRLVMSRNVAFDVRYADGKVDRLPTLAAELVAHRPAVIAT